MSKANKARSKATRAEVQRQVYFALYGGGSVENPYPDNDARHTLFARELVRVQRDDGAFEDMCAVMGTDTSTWQQGEYSDPVSTAFS